MKPGNGTRRVFRPTAFRRAPWIVWAALVALIGFIVYMVL